MSGKREPVTVIEVPQSVAPNWWVLPWAIAFAQAQQGVDGVCVTTDRAVVPDPTPEEPDRQRSILSAPAGTCWLRKGWKSTACRGDYNCALVSQGW